MAVPINRGGGSRSRLAGRAWEGAWGCHIHGGGSSNLHAVASRDTPLGFCGWRQVGCTRVAEHKECLHQWKDLSNTKESSLRPRHELCFVHGNACS